MEFSNRLIEIVRADSSNTENEELGKFCLLYFLTVTVRSAEKSEIPKNLSLLVEIL